MTDRVILVPGFWLGAWAWDEVADDLRRRDIDVLALTLPGLDPADPNRLAATLDTQAEAIVAAVPAGERAVLVAHSGGGAAAYRATDLEPTRFRRAIYVDSSPLPDGFVLNPDLAPDAAEVALPSWSELTEAGNSLLDLDDAMLSRFREHAVSEPARVAGGRLTLHDPARLTVPTTVVCNSFPSTVVQQMRDAGTAPMFAELARIDAEYVDLPTGHWPMWSKPKELAELIATVAQRRTTGRADAR